MINKIKSAFSLPSAWRTEEPKVSEWVDERNKMPYKIVIESQTDGSLDVWFDVTMYHFGRKGDHITLSKTNKKDGWLDWDTMQTIHKCILKNWRER